MLRMIVIVLVVVTSLGSWQGTRGFDESLTTDVYADLQGRIGRVVK